jgi:carbon monoxide dehydrogenase subunit G
VLTDPAVLARTIPGCLALERVGEDSYRMDVSVGVGAVKGTYAGEVHLTDQERPTSYVMHASGAGAPGQVRATVTIELAPSEDSSTVLTYSADAVVGGPVAGVGQRMITGVAKRMAAQFFTAVDAELAGARVPAGTHPSPAVVSATEATTPATQPQVFTGRAGVPAGTSGDLRTLALGAVGGSLLTLIGVLVGYRLGRR